ncbi:MAG: PDZ domain-containing protein [Acidimicrobiia bacterium]
MATPVVEPVAPAAPVDPTVAAPVAAAPVAAAPAQHNGFFIPRWVGYVAIAIVGMLIVGGIGYAIGHESSSSNSNNAGANFPGGMQNGNGFPGGMQNGNGNTNGNSNGNSNLPQFPGQNGNQNGNSNGNQNGNSNGGSRTSGGFLGVAIQDPTSGSGAEVTSVQSGSPADDAGLQAGDVITKVDGTDIAGAAALSQAIRPTPPATASPSPTPVTATPARPRSRSAASPPATTDARRIQLLPS